MGPGRRPGARSYRDRVTTSTPGTIDSTAPGGTALRLRLGQPFLVLAVASVVAGGMVAAASAHAPTEHPVWASAYLVLVTGVAQIGLVLGRVLLTPNAPRASALWRDLGIWLLGNVGVLVGTLTDRVWLVDVGGVLLVVALALCIWAVRAHTRADHPRLQTVLWLYRLVVVVLLVSIPIGLILARR